jgi:hypothetical protein
MDRDSTFILAQTQALRHNHEPMWARLRQLLTERGLNPSSVALVEFFPDDSHFEFGILATSDGKLYQFGFDYLNRKPEDGAFTEWRDCSGTIPHPCSARSLEIGFKVAKGEQSAL